MSNSRVFADTEELQYSTDISSSETDTGSDIYEIESDINETEELKYFIINRNNYSRRMREWRRFPTYNNRDKTDFGILGFQLVQM